MIPQHTYGCNNENYSRLGAVSIMSTPGNRNGSSRVEATACTNNADLQQFILESIQKSSDKIVHHVQAQFQEIDSALKDVKDRIKGLEAHCSELKTLADGLSQAASEDANRLKKKRKLVSSDGEIFLAELEDDSSDFKARLRERLRKFCLSAEGHMYFQGMKEKFASKLPNFVVIF